MVAAISIVMLPFSYANASPAGNSNPVINSASTEVGSEDNFKESIPESLFGVGKTPRRNSEDTAAFIVKANEEDVEIHENVKYSTAHKLPITWIVEDNGKSVCTDTRSTWNMGNLSYEELDLLNSRDNVIYYKYETKYPHAGAGKRIQF